MSTGKAMAKDASDQAGDITVLAIHEGGMRKPIGAKKPLNSLAAFKGAKIRASQSKVMATGLRSLGAEADPIPLPEVYQALQNGTVDGMEANLGLVVEIMDLSKRKGVQRIHIGAMPSREEDQP